MLAYAKYMDDYIAYTSQAAHNFVGLYEEVKDGKKQAAMKVFTKIPDPPETGKKIIDYPTMQRDEKGNEKPIVLRIFVEEPGQPETDKKNDDPKIMPLDNQTILDMATACVLDLEALCAHTNKDIIPEMQSIIDQSAYILYECQGPERQDRINTLSTETKHSVFLGAALVYLVIQFEIPHSFMFILLISILTLCVAGTRAKEVHSHFRTKLNAQYNISMTQPELDRMKPMIKNYAEKLKELKERIKS